MKLFNPWLVVSTALSMTLAATAAFADVQTPLRSPIVISGTSGGNQSSQCGSIANAPNQTVRVTESFAPLRFRVESAGEPTLLITSAGGRNQCVMADSFSGGTIEVPGVWEQGTYSVYVGDRSGGRHSFTLTITQGQ